jgi:hypothetical protein
MPKPTSPEETEAKLALFEAFAKAVGLKPGHTLTPRQVLMIHYSDETKRAILKLIELSPVLEEAIINLAELAFSDGVDSTEDWLWTTIASGTRHLVMHQDTVSRPTRHSVP